MCSGRKPYCVLQIRNVTYNPNSAWQTVSDVILDVDCGVNTPKYTVYPNPASGIITIDLQEDTNQTQITLGGEQSKKEKIYDVRLYDLQGNMLRQATAKGGKMKISVANLTSGIYLLHIYDGVSEFPEIKRIVVQH
jgi:hypothetical protein